MSIIYFTLFLSYNPYAVSSDPASVIIMVPLTSMYG